MRPSAPPLPPPLPKRQTGAIASLIRARLRVRPVPGLSGLLLHMAGPDSRIGQLAAGHAAPYWAYPWAGGLALARHIEADPTSVAGRTVLDLGAGSGLVGIAAARAGARHVVANEIDPHGVVAIGLNADANGVALTVEPRDLLDEDAPSGIEVVMVGDLFYEAALARRVSAFLCRCRAAGLTVLVGDPGRTPLPVGSLVPLARYAVGDVGLGATEAASAGVFGWQEGP